MTMTIALVNMEGPTIYSSGDTPCYHPRILIEVTKNVRKDHSGLTIPDHIPYLLISAMFLQQQYHNCLATAMAQS